jgi:nucleotide-binding universal stress UspA family protein
MAVELLVATNGYLGTWPAIEYGAWLANSLQMKITLLGVTEKMSSVSMEANHPLENMLEKAVSLFKDKGVEYSLDVRSGEAEHVIPEKANNGDYMVVVGPLGRSQLKRWLTGRSIRPLMEKIENPIVYVPQIRIPVKKILVSIGGLGYAESAENLAFQVAAACNAEVIILHVVPRAELNYPGTREVRDHLDDLVNTDTLPGRSLRKALEMGKELGLNAGVVTRVGNIVEQILEELKEGDYDIVCKGSTYSTDSLRKLYTPNVTAEIAEIVHLPVMTARYKSM